MTEYVVLQKIGLPDNSPGYIVNKAPVEASSGEGAIRKAIVGRDHGGTFVAVPMRSFAEVTVTIETQRTVRVGEAEPEPEALSEPELEPESEDAGPPEGLLDDVLDEMVEEGLMVETTPEQPPTKGDVPEGARY